MATLSPAGKWGALLNFLFKRGYLVNTHRDILNATVQLYLHHFTLNSKQIVADLQPVLKAFFNGALPEGIAIKKLADDTIVVTLPERVLFNE